MQRDLSTRVGATEPRVCVEFPVESDRLTLTDTEPIIEWRRPTTGLRDAARADANLVDRDHKRLPRQRPANLDRPDQRMSLPWRAVGTIRTARTAASDTPVQARERDRVSRLDRQDRLEAREKWP
jgi:hypothetical protein